MSLLESENDDEFNDNGKRQTFPPQKYEDTVSFSLSESDSFLQVTCYHQHNIHTLLLTCTQTHTHTQIRTNKDINI